MKKLLLLFYILLIYYNQNFAQNNDSLIFKNFVYQYKCEFISTNNTKTNEQLILKKLNTKWKFDEKQQAIEYSYFPDTIGLKTFVNPVIGWRKRMEKYQPWQWTKKEVTGLFENENFLWQHPPRSNQYIYCQIAPFPEVKFKKLFIDSVWNSSLTILGGIPKRGEFKGIVNSKFKVISKDTFLLNGEIIPNCWKIEAIGIHSRLGENKLTFIFNNDFGIIEYDYHFYDGTRLIIHLEKTTND